MLYTIEKLPKQVLELSKEFQDYWFAAYKSAFDIKSNDLIASKAAWKVLRGILELPTDLPLYISKANLDDDGHMTFLGTASDTKKDVYTDKMTVDLFEGFIKEFRGDEYVCLSHYKRLDDGSGEIGRIDKIYLDGNYLKVKGNFNETPLGKATYNAIRKDRRDDVPVERRVRLSIGFYDRYHKHGNDLEWRYDNEKPAPCVHCLLGMKEKSYLYGIFDHVAATRRPANRRTDIEVD